LVREEEKNHTEFHSHKSAPAGMSRNEFLASLQTIFPLKTTSKRLLCLLLRNKPFAKRTLCDSAGINPRMSQYARGSPFAERGVLKGMLWVYRQGKGSYEIFVLKEILQNLHEKQKLVEKPCYIL